MKKSLFKVTSQSQEKKGNSITAFDFFKENNPNGYYFKPEFLKVTESLERNEPEQFVEILENLEKGYRIKLETKVRIDKSGKEYIWVDFIFARAVRGLKLVGDAGMVKFISDYAHGKINVDFTIDDLTDEAFKD